MSFFSSDLFSNLKCRSRQKLAAKTFILQYWNLLALDGSNWQRVDLFDFQTDVEVCVPFVY